MQTVPYYVFIVNGCHKVYLLSIFSSDLHCLFDAYLHGKALLTGRHNLVDVINNSDPENASFILHSKNCLLKMRPALGMQR